MVIGTLVKLATKVVRGRSKTKELSRLVSLTESEYNRPILTRFSGSQRFDAAARLLDATLIRRLASSPRGVERERIIDLYLQKNFEEYTMAKEELGAIHASRSEVIALGIALKEMALCLDAELAKIDHHREKSSAEQQSMMGDSLAGMKQTVQSELGHFKAAVTSRVQELDHQVNSKLSKSLSVLEVQLQEKLSKDVAEQMRKISGSIQTARAEILADMRGRTDGHLRMLTSALSKQEAELSDMSGKLSAMVAAQESFFTKIDNIAKVQRWWIVSGFVIAILALIAALVS